MSVSEGKPGIPTMPDESQFMSTKNRLFSKATYVNTSRGCLHIRWANDLIHNSRGLLFDNSKSYNLEIDKITCASQLKIIINKLSVSSYTSS